MTIEIVNVRGIRPNTDIVYTGRRCMGWEASPLDNPFKVWHRERDPIQRYHAWLYQQILNDNRYVINEHLWLGYRQIVHYLPRSPYNQDAPKVHWFPIHFYIALVIQYLTVGVFS